MKQCINVEHMTKELGDFKLENIHFSVEPGYVLGLIGRNGAGKTTLLNTILGIWSPDKGKIYIGGYDRTEDEVKTRNETAFITDECLFPSDMSPRAIGRVFSMAYTRFDYKHYCGLCRRFALPLHRPIRKMSKGMVMKLQIALAFSRNAQLYVFDEPSAGLDPVFRKEFVDIIYELIQDGTKTVIFSTHLTDELDRIADFILFIEKGKQLLFEQKEELISRYRLLRGSKEKLLLYEDLIIGKRITENSSEALIWLPEPMDSSSNGYDTFLSASEEGLQMVTPTIEDIMYYYLKGTEATKC